MTLTAADSTADEEVPEIGASTDRKRKWQQPPQRQPHPAPLPQGSAPFSLDESRGPAYDDEELSGWILQVNIS